MPFAPERRPAAPQRILEAIIDGIGQVVLGKERQVRLALACLLARGHLLIEDLPGMGKTTLAQVLAQVLGLQFKRVQFTSDLLPADILGVSIYQPDTKKFRVSSRAGVRATGARRRNQSRDAENAERTARGHGRTPGHHRRAPL